MGAKASIDHAENLADPALGLDLDCIRSNIILNTDDGTLPMVPVFSNTYGMLVNNSLFEKEGLSIPTTYRELVEVCDSFREKANLQFSVNKDSSNTDMANEFMRFLISSGELNEMAQNKGLMSPTKDLSFNSMYAAFGSVNESQILSPEEIGLTDDAVIQLRQAVYLVGTGEMSIDEAIAGYGSFTQ